LTFSADKLSRHQCHDDAVVAQGRIVHRDRDIDGKQFWLLLILGLNADKNSIDFASANEGREEEKCSLEQPKQAK
jgi:hypothetical protein